VFRFNIQEESFLFFFTWFDLINKRNGEEKISGRLAKNNSLI